MAHEVTETWEINGKWHVRPSVGKNKGKSASEFRVPKVGLLQKRGLA